MSRPTLDDWVAKKIGSKYCCHDEAGAPRLQREALERYQLDRINRTLVLAFEKSSDMMDFDSFLARHI